MARGVDSVVRIKKQTAVNQAATFAITDKGEVTPFTSETFAAKVTQVASQALRRVAQRQKKLTRLGTLDVGGSVTVEPTNNALANLLPLLFPADGITAIGAEVAPSYAKRYALTSTARDLATIAVDDGEVVRAYANMTVGQFSLNSSVNKLVEMSIDWVGTHADTNVGGASKAWTNGITGTIPQVGLGYASPVVEYGLYFDEAMLQIGTAAGSVTELYVSDFSLSVNLNATSDRYRLGSRYRIDVPTGIADVTGSFTIDANRLPVSGTGVLSAKDWAYQSIANSTYLALQVSFIDPVNLAKTGTPSSLTIKLPFIYIDTPSFNISGPDIIRGAVNFTGFADGATGLSFEHVYALDS